MGQGLEAQRGEAPPEPQGSDAAKPRRRICIQLLKFTALFPGLAQAKIEHILLQAPEKQLSPSAARGLIKRSHITARELVHDAPDPVQGCFITFVEHHRPYRGDQTQRASCSGNPTSSETTQVGSVAWKAGHGWCLPSATQMMAAAMKHAGTTAKPWGWLLHAAKASGFSPSLPTAPKPSPQRAHLRALSAQHASRQGADEELMRSHLKLNQCVRRECTSASRG